MKSASDQIQGFAVKPRTPFDPRVKCVLMAAYENNGKTILQPLISGQEIEAIAELFNNKTLEVWLSNGEKDLSKFDIGILKYRQVMQPLLKCPQTRNRACLKNILKNLVSCEQCPQDLDNGEILIDKS